MIVHDSYGVTCVKLPFINTSSSSSSSISPSGGRVSTGPTAGDSSSIPAMGNCSRASYQPVWLATQNVPQSVERWISNWMFYRLIIAFAPACINVGQKRRALVLRQSEVTRLKATCALDDGKMVTCLTSSNKLRPLLYERSNSVFRDWTENGKK